MAFDGSDQCWVPDVPIGRKEKWRLDIAQFGDGYAQRVLDGINALDQQWSVSFELRPFAVINAMLNYLVTQKGNSFQFKEPATKVVYDVWCDEWQVDWVLRRKGPTPTDPVWYGTLTAEFVKANGITG